MAENSEINVTLKTPKLKHVFKVKPEITIKEVFYLFYYFYLFISFY